MVIQLGSFGVSIFFLISGFLLYRPFVVAHFASRPAPPVVPFWIRHAFRIFPAYWLTLTVFVYGFGSYHIHSFSAFVTYYGLLQTYRADFQAGGLGVAWTLVIELSFYAFLPFFADRDPSRARDAARRRPSSGRTSPVLAVLYGVAMGFRWWRLWFLHPPAAHFGQLFPIEQVGSWLISYLDWFALGMLLAVARPAWERGGHHIHESSSSSGAMPGRVGCSPRVAMRSSSHCDWVNPSRTSSRDRSSRPSSSSG